MFAIESSRRTYYNLKSKYFFYKFVKRPEDTLGIIAMTDALQKAALPELKEKMLGPLYADPRLYKAYQSKFWPKLPNFQELKELPEGSYGKKASEFFEKYHLDPDLFPPPDFSSREKYLTSRVYQAHDFWHVLTGYDTSLEEELALQAFGVGQYKQAISLAIITGGLMHLLQRSPERAPRILGLIAEGFERGKKAKNLLLSPVLERLAEPLEVVRADLGIPERTRALQGRELDEKEIGFH